MQKPRHTIGGDTKNNAIENVQALLVTFDSLSKEGLPKQKRKLLFSGNVVEATGEATIIYKPVKCSDGSTELQLLTVSWTDNVLDYFINIVGSLDDE